MKFSIQKRLGPWLNHIDAFWACQLIHKRNLVSGLEIGLYEGSWTLLILDNLPLAQIIGIDPYPGLSEIRERMELSTANYSKNERFTHFESLEDIPKGIKFDFVHIDGEHSEQAVRYDLLFSFASLNEGGMIIIDDFMSRLFPGVTAETILVAHELNLKPVLITENKIYLVRDVDYEIYYKQIVEISTSYGTGESATYQNGLYGETYIQDGLILGATAYVQPTLSNRKKRELLSEQNTVNGVLKSMRYFLVPPIFELIITTFGKFFKRDQSNH